MPTKEKKIKMGPLTSRDRRRVRRRREEATVPSRPRSPKRDVTVPILVKRGRKKGVLSAESSATGARERERELERGTTNRPAKKRAGRKKSVLIFFKEQTKKRAQAQTPARDHSPRDPIEAVKAWISDCCVRFWGELRVKRERERGEFCCFFFGEGIKRLKKKKKKAAFVVVVDVKRSSFFYVVSSPSFESSFSDTARASSRRFLASHVQWKTSQRTWRLGTSRRVVHGRVGVHFPFDD